MRFFIDIATDQAVVTDQDGAEFPLLEEALREVGQLARELAIDELRDGRSVPVHWRFRIRNAQGRTVKTCMLRDFVLDANSSQLWHSVQRTAASVIAAQAEIRTTVADLRRQLHRLSEIRRLN